MGKSAGKPGEMRYTGEVTHKGKTVGESFRDSRNREWVQEQGKGTPKKYAKGGEVRGYGAARKPAGGVKVC